MSYDMISLPFLRAEKLKLTNTVIFFQRLKIRKPEESENNFVFSDSKFKFLPTVFGFFNNCMVTYTRSLVERYQSFGLSS